MGALDGKVAVVLGAAGPGNMGQVIARRLAAEGAKLVVAGRHLGPLEALASEIGGAFAIADVTRRADLAAMAEAAIARFGRLDIAVNAAGAGVMKPFLETTEEEIDQLCALQFRGAFLFLQEVLKRISDGGSIILVSSATATIMLENYAAYMGTKAGADHVARCAANEFGHRGIRVNSVSPGFTVTPMTAAAAATPGLIDAFVKEYPLGRVGTSEDVAAAIAFLARDDCFLTGQNLQVNGGLTLRRNPTGAEIGAAVAAAMAKAG
ncbi:SDR family oxidoreductase [Thermaurantiacus sp.]